MLKKWALGLFAVLLSAQALAVTDMEFRMMQEKVNSLEKTLSEMSLKTYGKQGSVQTYFADSLSLGGFFENSLTSIWGDDTPSQTVADSHRLGINFSADLHPRFHIVAQYSFGFSYAFRNEHNNPNHGSTLIPLQRGFDDVTYGALLSQGFGEYEVSDYLKIQMGMGYVPFGRAYQVRDPVLFLKRRGPQLLRTSGLSRVIISDPFWKGLHILGALDSKKSWNYNVYTMSSLDHSGKLGGGGRVSWTNEGILTLGMSGQTAGQAGDTYTSYGADATWQGARYGITIEWAQLDSDLGNTQSYYIEPFVKLYDQSLVLFVDADYIKNPLGQTTLGGAAVNDPYIKWEYSAGLNYSFLANAKVRLEMTFHDYTGDRAALTGQERDYYSASLSSGLSF